MSNAMPAAIYGALTGNANPLFSRLVSAMHPQRWWRAWQQAPAHLRGLPVLKLPANQLYRELCDPAQLEAAFAWLCEQPSDAFEHSDVWDYRRDWAARKTGLARALKLGTFTFQTVRVVEVRNDQGALERHEIRCAEDRLVIRAMAQVLQPVLQTRLSEHCTHLANNGGVQQAVRDTQAYIEDHPDDQVIKSDVKGYYANIDHGLLADQLRHLLPHETSLHGLLWTFMRRTTEFGGDYKDVDCGLPLGASLSPLLGAVYLSPLDNLAKRTGGFYRRYMDDWVWVLPKKTVLRKAIKAQYDVLQALRVEIHPGKTFIGRVDKGFDFLGFHCCPTGMRVSDAALSRRDKKVARLYEQGASRRRIGRYLVRWLGWAIYCLGPCSAVGDTLPQCTIEYTSESEVIGSCGGSTGEWDVGALGIAGNPLWGGSPLFFAYGSFNNYLYTDTIGSVVSFNWNEGGIINPDCKTQIYSTDFWKSWPPVPPGVSGYGCIKVQGSTGSNYFKITYDSNYYGTNYQEYTDHPTWGVSATSSPALGGSASCSSPVDYNGSATCTVTSINPGYSYAGWTRCTSVDGSGVCTVTNVITNVLVTANFTYAVANAGSTPQTAGAGAIFGSNLSVTLTGADGNLASGVSVTFTAPASGASGTFSNSFNTITATTDSSGVAAVPFTANGVLGSYAVTATATGYASVLFSLTNTAGNATHFTVSAPATANAGTPVSVSVTALDQYNNTATGYSGTVHFTSTDPAATLSSDSTLSSGAGSFSATLKTAGNQTVTATDTLSSLITGSSGSIAISAAAASKLAFGQSPTNTVAGASISPAVTVQVQDQFGNLVSTNTSNVSVGLSANPGGGTLSGTATMAAVNGVATFSNLSINKTGTGYTLAFSDSGLSGTTSSAFNITPADSSRLVFVGQPSNTNAGSTISPAVTVQIRDQFGNLATGDTSNVTVALGGPNPLGGTLSGTTSPAAVAGVATFSNLSINRAGPYFLTATDGILSNTQSSGFIINAVAQTISFTTTAPSNATAGGASYTVAATGGGSGNPVTFTIDASATLVCSINGSTVTFIGGGTCVVDANQAAGGIYAAANQVQQSFNVASVRTYTGPAPTGGAQSVSFTSTDTGCTFDTGTTTFNAASPGADAGFLPIGGINILRITGCSNITPATIQVSITYPSIPSGAVYRKYGPTPSNPATSNWYNFGTVSGNTVSFSITDGQLGDDDVSANGVILDPGSLSLPTGSGATAIPTLTERGLMLLGAVLALFGLYQVRRRYVGWV